MKVSEQFWITANVYAAGSLAASQSPLAAMFLAVVWFLLAAAFARKDDKND